MTLLRREHFADFDFIKGGTYIECGAGFGDSLAIALAWFPICHAIEVSPVVFEELAKKFKDKATLHFGSSVDILPQILHTLDKNHRTTFFLDSHIQPEHVGTFDPKIGQCPLLHELKIIVSQPWTVKPVIMIDDYPAFMSDHIWWDRYAGPDHKKEDWPRWSDIYELLGGVEWQYNFLASTNGILYCYP